MKRHPSLEPFSRDHNVVLVLARRVETATPSEISRVASELAQLWTDELENHFAEEERLLLNLIRDTALREQLLDEHREIAGLIADLPASAHEAALRLRDHVRWEERTLFQHIQDMSSEAELKDLAERTAEVEVLRADSNWSPRRGELVNKRRSRQYALEASPKDAGGRMRKLPDRYVAFVKDHPAVGEAYQALGSAVSQAGPLDKKTQLLIKVGICVAAGLEGGTHSACRKALDSGCTPEELRHCALQALTSIGFPAMMKGLSWVDDVVNASS